MMCCTLGTNIVHEVQEKFIHNAGKCTVKIVLCEWKPVDWFPKYKESNGPVTCKRCLIHKDRTNANTSSRNDIERDK
jgi:hypothetical protein